MTARTSVISVTILAATMLPNTSIAACGDRGGPGYRGPSGRCVSWAEIGRVCGSPPSTRCTAENTSGPDAETAAELGDTVQKLRSKASEKTTR
jgi:hypothetical protein